MAENENSRTKGAFKLFSRGSEAFTKWDYFGTPIKVNLQGQHTYKTCFGAILTVIFAIVMCT